MARAKPVEEIGSGLCLRRVAKEEVIIPRRTTGNGRVLASFSHHDLDS